jgi:hypothetical protein
MTLFKATELEVLGSRLLLIQSRIIEERLALSLHPSGSSERVTGSTSGATEARRERLRRCEEVELAIKRSIAAYHAKIVTEVTDTPS